MPSYSAVYRIDQQQGDSLIRGTPGISRRDLWIGGRITLTPTNAPVRPAPVFTWEFMDKPPASTAVLSAPDAHGAVTFTPDVWGMYRIRLVLNRGAYSEIKLCAVLSNEIGEPMQRSWRYAAFKEIDTEANFVVGGVPQERGYADDMEFILNDILLHMPNSGDAKLPYLFVLDPSASVPPMNHVYPSWGALMADRAAYGLTRPVIIMIMPVADGAYPVAHGGVVNGHIVGMGAAGDTNAGAGLALAEDSILSGVMSVQNLIISAVNPASPGSVLGSTISPATSTRNIEVSKSTITANMPIPEGDAITINIGLDRSSWAGQLSLPADADRTVSLTVTHVKPISPPSLNITGGTVHSQILSYSLDVSDPQVFTYSDFLGTEVLQQLFVENLQGVPVDTAAPATGEVLTAVNRGGSMIWSPQPSGGGGGDRTLLIFWPSYGLHVGSPQTNIFTTWPDVMAARALIAGPVRIRVEGTTSDEPGVLSDAITWDMSEVTLEAPVDVSKMAQLTSQLQGITGGHLRLLNGAKLVDIEFAKGVSFQSRSTWPIFDSTSKTSPDPDNIVIINAESCTYQLDNVGGGTSPLFPPAKVLIANWTNGCALSKTNCNLMSDCVVHFCAPKRIPGGLSCSGLIIATNIMIPGQYTLNGEGSGGGAATVYVAVDDVSGLLSLPQLNFNTFGDLAPDPALGTFNLALTSAYMTVLQSYNTFSLQSIPVAHGTPALGDVLTAVASVDSHQPPFIWTAQPPNRNATAIQNVPVSATGPTATQVLTGVDVGGVINWVPQDPASGGVQEVFGESPVVVTNGETYPVISLDTNPLPVDELIIRTTGFFMGSAPLNFNDGSVDQDYKDVMGPPPTTTGAYYINKSLGTFLDIAIGTTREIPIATGYENWWVACVHAVVFGTMHMHFTVYFRAGDFSSAAELRDWMIARYSGHLTIFEIPVFDVAFNCGSDLTDYTWAQPTNTNQISPGYAYQLDYINTVHTQLGPTTTQAVFNTPVSLGGASTDAITVNGRLLVRTITSTVSVAGTSHEIAWNSSDGFLYQCTTTGDPATWVQLGATLYTDLSAGTQVVQTVFPQWTTVGAKFISLEPGALYFFKAVLAANDDLSSVQIQGFANGAAITTPSTPVFGKTLVSGQTPPAAIVGASPMLIEAQVTLSHQDSSTSRAACYSFTLVKNGV